MKKLIHRFLNWLLDLLEDVDAPLPYDNGGGIYANRQARPANPGTPLPADALSRRAVRAHFLFRE